MERCLGRCMGGWCAETRPARILPAARLAAAYLPLLTGANPGPACLRLAARAAALAAGSGLPPVYASLLVYQEEPGCPLSTLASLSSRLADPCRVLVEAGRRGLLGFTGLRHLEEEPPPGSVWVASWAVPVLLPRGLRVRLAFCGRDSCYPAPPGPRPGRRQVEMAVAAGRRDLAGLPTWQHVLAEQSEEALLVRRRRRVLVYAAAKNPGYAAEKLWSAARLLEEAAVEPPAPQAAPTLPERWETGLAEVLAELVGETRR